MKTELDKMIESATAAIERLDNKLAAMEDRAHAMTIQKAAGIIESYVSDWDPKVIRDAATHAVNGGSPWAFEGRPEDDDEMKAFCEAFKQIQSGEAWTA